MQLKHQRLNKWGRWQSLGNDINSNRWPFLRAAGVNSKDVESGFIASEPITIDLLNNGAVYELTRLKISWPKRAACLRAWMGSRLPGQVNDRQIRNVLEKLVKQRSNILTKKKNIRQTLLHTFLNQPFTIQSNQPVGQSETTEVRVPSTSADYQVKVEAKLQEQERLLKNCRRREKQKHKLIKRQKSIIRDDLRLIRRLSSANDTKKLRNRKRYEELLYLRKLKFRQPSSLKSTQTTRLDNDCNQCHRYEQQLQEIQKADIKKVRKIPLTKGRVYTADVVECVLALLNSNVAYEHVGPVMRAVLKLVKVEPEDVPSRSTVERIAHLRLPLSHVNVATVFLEEGNTTLYTDETSKSGKQFEAYVVSSQTQVKALGLREIADKSASTNLETLKEIVEDFERCGSDTGKKLVANLKNTMSDRAAAEKSFQKSLALYRNEILPTVTPQWSSMSEQDRAHCYRMHNFFCGLHLLVNAAETANKALLSFEERYKKVHEVSGSVLGLPTTGESETVHLIRASSKAFAPGEDERNGCHGDANVFLKAKGECHCLSRFKGNRFNILFHNAAILYSQKEFLVEFLDHCHGTTNALLAAVSTGLKSDLLLSGMRALAVIDKRLTKPLWQVIEGKGSILEMNKIYAELIATLDVAPVESIMDGSVRVVTTSRSPTSTPDKVLAAITASNRTDALTVQILEHVLTEIKTAFTHLLKDQLPGGLHAGKTIQTNPECSSVLKHNKIPETVFGQLDYWKRNKPSASTLTLESTILYKFNKVSEWLQTLGEEGLQSVIKQASSLRKLTDAQFHERVKVIQHKKHLALQKKSAEISRRAEKLLAEKTKLTESVVFHGLWQSADQVESKLSTYLTQAAKKEALRAQINFRKKVLAQLPSSHDLFAFSKNRVTKTVAQLTNNLKTLIEESAGNGDSSEETTTSPLVGAKIGHRFLENGCLVTYEGRVISQVPGFPRWFNVVYVDEPDVVYTFRLEEDLDRKDLWILEDVKPSHE